jgi:HD-like signal output (HDOD) protein
LDHIEIGSKVDQHWNLPRTIQEAIEQHESLPKQGKVVSLGGQIYLANKLVKAAGKNSNFEANALNNTAEVLEAFNIPFEQAKQWANNSRKFADQILSAG